MLARVIGIDHATTFSFISDPALTFDFAFYAHSVASGLDEPANIGGRYVSFLASTAQAMRASLFAKATPATLRCVRDVSWVSHALRPEDCFALCCRTARAPCTKSLRKSEFPRLLIPSSFCLPPVVCSPGTTPSQAANSRPLRKAAPLPIAAMTAVAVIGPMPGIATSRRQALSSLSKRRNPRWPWSHGRHAWEGSSCPLRWAGVGDGAGGSARW